MIRLMIADDHTILRATLRHFLSLNDDILVLSMHNQAQIAMRVLKAGAAGYLTKDQEAETMLAAIRKVAAGGRFIDPALAEQMAFEASGIAPRPQHTCLSDREFEILCLLASGTSLNGIAAKFAISSKTVSTHKGRLMEKMGFVSNAELVRYALAHGLVS